MHKHTYPCSWWWNIVRFQTVHGRRQRIPGPPRQQITSAANCFPTPLKNNNIKITIKHNPSFSNFCTFKHKEGRLLRVNGQLLHSTVFKWPTVGPICFHKLPKVATSGGVTLTPTILKHRNWTPELIRNEDVRDIHARIRISGQKLFTHRRVGYMTN